MTAQDFVQPNASVQQIRHALSVSKTERQAICEGNKAIKRAVLALGSGGRICAQCEAFKALGNIPGMNGTCWKVDKTRFTLPEKTASQFFNQRKDCQL